MAPLSLTGAWGGLPPPHPTWYYTPLSQTVFNMHTHTSTTLLNITQVQSMLQKILTDVGIHMNRSYKFSIGLHLQVPWLYRGNKS